MRLASILQAAFASSPKTVLRALSTGSFNSFRGVAMALSEKMQVKKLSENAIMPVRGSEHAAGFDLASAYDTTVPAGRQAIIKTDISIAIPPNTYARIAPRSGLAVKKMIDCGAGVVDYDYRGPVGVVLFNHGSEDFEVKKGDRIAQLILERICMADIEEVSDLPETARGSGGFGSTGVEQKALQASTEENKMKKFKLSESEVPEDSKRIAKLLQLVDRINKMDLGDGSLIGSLRRRAFNTPTLLEIGMVGAIQHFDETGDKEGLLENLRAFL